MIKLGVIFGSRAAEHDVSIISGLQILENADKSKYDAFPIYISRKGEWFIGEPLRDIKNLKNFDPNMKGLTRVCMPAIPGYNGLMSMEQGTGGLFGKKNASSKVAELDCAILAMHGMNGEDGTLQGLFELADIPYSSAGVTGSAVGMDKIVMKAVFESMGLPVLPGKYFYRSECEKDMERVLSEAEKLGYPLFVKPANLGSSIGISRVNDRDALVEKIELALSFSRRILVERCIDPMREINCAVLGEPGDVITSLCEEPLNGKDILSFDDKYLSSDSSKGMSSAKRQIPADLTPEQEAQIRTYAERAFNALDFRGVCRVDFLIDVENGEQIYVNEPNTIPGSLSFYLFEPAGIGFSQLLDRMLKVALKAKRDQDSLTRVYTSNILAQEGFKGKK